ncbi:MAG: anti-sigma factor, partial [Phyllobacteriaceae bacterium]|nr:anti-sigma factor [Phyllobacteriaceae bacterium]
EPQVASLLGNVPSGEERRLDNGSRLKVIATFKDETGGLCREFEVDGTDGKALVSVACRAGAVWDLRFTVAAAQNELGYAPASSLETLDAFYTATGALPPLSADEEKAALAGLQ